MGSDELRLTARHDLTPDEIDELEQRIYEYNASKTGHGDAAQIGFTLHSGEALIGAAAGYTWAGMCELRQLWMDETHRGQGYGRKLLLQFIEEARSRHCTKVYVATYEFQAPRFYNRFGFRPVAAVNGRPSGHLDILMCLTLERTPVNDAGSADARDRPPPQVATSRAAGLY